MRMLGAVVVALLLALAGACGSGSEGISADGGDNGTDEAGAATDDTDDTGDTSDTGDTDDTGDGPPETMAPDAPPGTITTSPQVDQAAEEELVEDLDGLVPLLNEYWSEEIPGYVPPEGPIAYISDEEPFPTCGGEEISGDNAAYCFDDNTVIFAIDYLLEQQEEIGDVFTYVVMAHEWGHSAQGAYDDLRAENSELQADCYAGAFIQFSLDTGVLEEEPGDAEEFNQSIAAISNEFGSEEFHGTLAQRSTAFEFGRTNGVEACRQTYTSSGQLPPTTVPFTPPSPAPPPTD